MEVCVEVGASYTKRYSDVSGIEPHNGEKSPVLITFSLRVFNCSIFSKIFLFWENAGKDTVKMRAVYIITIEFVNWYYICKLCP